MSLIMRLSVQTVICSCVHWSSRCSLDHGERVRQVLHNLWWTFERQIFYQNAPLSIICKYIQSFPLSSVAFSFFFLFSAKAHSWGGQTKHFTAIIQMWHKTLDLEESDRYEILTQREEMVLGSASEKHILITQSVWQSYNSGSMFAYVAHGAFGRWLHDCSASCSGWQHCEIFPKARQTPAKAHSSFSARKGQSSDGSEGFWKSGRLKKVMLKRVRKEKMNRCPCCLMYLQKLNKKSGFSSFRDLLPAYWCKISAAGLSEAP